MVDPVDDNEDEGGQQTIEEQFEKWFVERTKREKAQADKRKEPKNFGEFLDRMASAVVDEAESRAAARSQARDDDDQEPSRGEQQGGFAKWWQGEKAAG